MAYIVPRALINQEFSQVPVVAEQPLPAFIFGPQYDLHRYSEADEKASTVPTHPTDTTLANKYQADTDVTYLFPNQAEGTEVDPSFVKVDIEKAEVEFYPNELDNTSGAVTRVAYPGVSGAYYPNRFKATSLVLKTANGVDRSADFSDRDVQVGDIVLLSDGSTTSTVKVKALHASKTNPSLGNATNDTNNAATATEDYNNAPVWEGEGAEPGDPPLNTSTNYVGYIEKGIVSDTYTVTCTATGALEDCRFTVSSANGAFADKLDQELDGSDVLTVDDGGLNEILLDFAAATVPEVGDVWTVSVTAAVTRLANGSTITASGTYTGTADTTYVLRVVRGGPLYDGTNGDVCARIAVTSTGTDSSPTVNVASATAFAVGTKGVTASITTGSANGGLILGDVYTVAATAAANSSVNIVETYESLPANLVANVGSFSITSLRYLSSFTVPEAIDAGADLYNWTVDTGTQEITINSGLTTTNSLIVNGDIPLDLPVKTGNLFITHRDLVKTNSVAISSVTAADQVEAILGKVDPANPIAQGVYLAALNAGSVPVYFCAVPSDDLSGYNTVLGLARARRTYYGLAPMTADPDVHSAVVGHVNAMSTAEEAKWRKAWLSPALVESQLLYDLNDGDDYVGTVTDDPLVSGTQYKLLTVGNAQFITDGVRNSDKVYLNFRTDSNGVVVYDTYTVDEVRTETTLVLTTALDSAINVAAKVQLARVYTKDEQAANFAALAGAYGSRRVNVVFPDEVANGSTTMPGYHMAAALAGLRAGVVPHQGLTNTTILGFTNVSQHGFNDTQLNVLAEAGVFIVTQDIVGSVPYVRHQLTTAPDSLNTAEDSVTTNVDSISFGLQDSVDPFIGTYNVYTDSLALIREAIETELDYRTKNTYTVRAGNQLISYTIEKFYQHPTLLDRVYVDIRLQVPYPVNFITITLLV